MIKFISLSLRNFLSYGNNITTIQLDKPGTTLIVGEDLDNTSSGQGANGTGKTAIINALTYAIYDRPVSNISKDNLINNTNKKNMEVTVEFIANNNKHYIIKRSRKTKSGTTGNTVLLVENGKDITPDSVANTNTLIEHIIGIPYELFVRIVVFSASHTPFLDLPTRSTSSANQSDIIEELFGLTMLSQKATILKDFIKDTETKIQTRQAKIETLEKEQARYQQQLEAAKKRVETWDIQTQQQIQNLKNKLSRLDKVDIELQKSLHDSLKINNENLNNLLEQKKTIEKNLKDLINACNKSEKDLLHLRDAKCPYCLQQFPNATIKIKEIEQQIEKTFSEIKVHKTNLDNVLEQISLLSLQIKNIKQQITIDDIEELLSIKNESKHIKRKIEELQATINPHLDALKELEKIKIEDIDYKEINEFSKVLEHQKILLKLLTKKDSFVRKALLNKNIPYLNARLQHYLHQLGLIYKVEFSHEMTASISLFDKTLDFGNLSAGQRARVNLALSFAFRDVLLNLHTKINVCLLDEVLDIGLDAVGVQAAARLLKRKARDEGISMYIISHRNEIDGAFDNTLTIQLSKGFSYIKEN